MFLLTDFQWEATFTMSQCSRLKLTHNGFEYTKSWSGPLGTYWRCVQNRRNKCKGKICWNKFEKKIDIRKFQTNYSLFLQAKLKHANWAQNKWFDYMVITTTNLRRSNSEEIY